MDWERATPSLVESGIGLALLLLAAGVYLIGHGRGADADSDGDPAPGYIVAVILLVVGGLTLWHGLDAFDQVVSQVKNR